jgi:hypothetical protein
MSFDLETIYGLLPANYRIRDHNQGKPLKALLSVISEQVAVLEEDLAQIYDDQFIETCREWVVPYIGDLVGARGIHELQTDQFSKRAQVANTLAYRRRKGTLAILEQLAQDATGWRTRAVEFFQLLATTQFMNHLRLHSHYAPDMRRADLLENLNSPFGRFSHTAEVRRIASRHGRYNIPNVGIFLWRVHAFSQSASPASRAGDHRYTFSSLGRDMQLFNLPQSEATFAHLAEPVNVPFPISRRILHRHREVYIGPGRSLELTVDGQPVPIGQIEICNLQDHNGGWAHDFADKYGIDPILGRIALPTNEAPKRDVRVTYHYGFSMEIGGGEYGREDSFSDLEGIYGVPDPHADIQTAVDQIGEDDGVTQITDSGIYQETPAIQLKPQQRIEIRAAEGRRPTVLLSGDLVVNGSDDAEVTINGLVISGGAIRVKGNLESLHLNHCTLVPGLSLNPDGNPRHADQPSLIVESAGVQLKITNSIIGGIRTEENTRTELINTILDATADTNVAYADLDSQSAGGSLDATSCTVIGKVHTRLLEAATNCIFLSRTTPGDGWEAPVLTRRLQQGCVRFSYLPADSKAPRRYRCQPADTDSAGRIWPQFNALRYGHPEYCQLSANCPVEIWQGADDEAEMGAFHDLYQPQRIKNLQVRLTEYLRFGLEAGIFFATAVSKENNNER